MISVSSSSIAECVTSAPIPWLLLLSHIPKIRQLPQTLWRNRAAKRSIHVFRPVETEVRSAHIVSCFQHPGLSKLDLQFRHVWNERWVSNSAEYASSPGPVNSGTIGFCSSKEIDGNASTGSSTIHIQNEAPPRVPPQQPRLVFRSPLLPPATPIDTPQTMFTPAMSHDGSTMQQNNIMGGVAPQPHPYPAGNDMDTVASNATVWHGRGITSMLLSQVC